MGKSGYGLSAELVVVSLAEVLGVGVRAFTSVSRVSVGQLPLKTLLTMFCFLFGRPGFTKGVDALDGVRADALKAEALDRFCFFLADRLFLKFFPLPVGVSF